MNRKGAREDREGAAARQRRRLAWNTPGTSGHWARRSAALPHGCPPCLLPRGCPSPCPPSQPSHPACRCGCQSRWPPGWSRRGSSAAGPAPRSPRPQSRAPPDEQHSTAQHVTAQHSTAQHSTAQHRKLRLPVPPVRSMPAHTRAVPRLTRVSRCGLASCGWPSGTTAFRSSTRCGSNASRAASRPAGSGSAPGAGAGKGLRTWQRSSHCTPVAATVTRLAGDACAGVWPKAAKHRCANCCPWKHGTGPAIANPTLAGAKLPTFCLKGVKTSGMSRRPSLKGRSSRWYMVLPQYRSSFPPAATTADLTCLGG